MACWPRIWLLISGNCLDKDKGQFSLEEENNNNSTPFEYCMEEKWDPLLRVFSSKGRLLFFLLPQRNTISSSFHFSLCFIMNVRRNLKNLFCLLFSPITSNSSEVRSGDSSLEWFYVGFSSFLYLVGNPHLSLSPYPYSYWTVKILQRIRQGCLWSTCTSIALGCYVIN